MEIVQFITPSSTIIGTITGWLLGRWGQQTDAKRRDDMKLKSLLYHLLEMKHWVEKEVYLDRELPVVIGAFRDRFVKEFSITNADFDEFMPELLETLKPQLLLLSPLTILETSIADLISSLSEIDPIFAYELTGRYQVSQKLESMKQMISALQQVTEPTEALAENEFNSMMRTPIMKDLLVDLNKHINQIALKIGRKTRREIEQISPSEPIPIDKEQMESFLVDFVPRLLAAGKKRSLN